jgi:hypothetical protein
MKPYLHLTCALFCALAAANAAAQQPTSGSGRALTVGKDSAADRVVKAVYQGKYSFVRIENREPGAAENQHPLAITPEAVRAALAQVTLIGRKPEPLMNEEELAEISAPLAQALGQATSAQEVSFAVAGAHAGYGPLSLKTVTTARVFQQGGQLNIIFGLLRSEFEGQLRGTGYLIPFEPGQRAKQLSRGVELAAAQAVVQRADWFKFNPAATAAAATGAAPAAAPQPAAPATPIVPAPAAVAPAAAVPAAPPAAATPPADALYKRTADRLKALQRLKDDGLISDKEFQEKRKAILAEF